MTEQIVIRKAQFPYQPSTIDEANRSVELIAATGAGVPRRDMDGDYVERLEISASAVDLTRLDGGLPLLDNHRQGSLADVIGTVRSVRIQDGKLLAVAEFSPRAEPLWQDVRRGVLRSVSIGYQVHEWREENGPKGRTKAAVRWTLIEISIVAAAADPGAKTRSITVSDTNTVDPPVLSRAQHNAEIRSLAELFDLGAGWTNNQIDAEATADQARADAMEQVKKRAARPAPTVQVVHDHNDPAAFVTRAAEAIVVSRFAPRAAMAPEARQFANMTTVDIAKHALAMRGVSTTGMSQSDVIGRAMSTSDLPLILGEVAHKTLAPAYQAAASVIKSIARQTTARDFRAKHSVSLSEAPLLEKVNEAGEYKRGSLDEARESYAIATYGKVIALTRQMIINDDLGALGDLAAMFGRAAAGTEADLMVGLLLANSGNGVTMADGSPLFHSSHANKAGTGAALDATTLSAGRLAMRKQRGIGGRPVSVVPRYLLLPAELETAGEKLLTEISPASSDQVNPFAGKLQLLVEPRLTSATRWYLSGDPAALPCIEFAYLQGHEGPQVETRAGFDVDGTEIKCRIDFGCGVVDWRGLYMNAGA